MSRYHIQLSPSGEALEAPNIGDVLTYVGNGEWEGQPGGGGGVSSVFGRTGAVVAQTGDYASSEITNDSTVTGSNVSEALELLDSQATLPWMWGAVGAPGTSGARFFARTFGAVGTAEGPGLYMVAKACLVRGIVVTCNVAMVTDSIGVTLRRGVPGAVLSDTTIAVTLPAGATQAIFTAPSPVSLAQADRLSIRLLQSSTEANAAWNGTVMLF